MVSIKGNTTFTGVLMQKYSHKRHMKINTMHMVVYRHISREIESAQTTFIQITDGHNF